MTGERKLVTVLFADVVGSTSLGAENEPEVVRDVMARYFERMKTAAETYGGTVEKFIGDAVMVVFGVPRLHDDDAERAVRCALAMQETIADLNRELAARLAVPALAVRVGVNSGRVVTGGAEGLLVTGDAVNVAARLQQGAGPGEIVVGSLTEKLTRHAIEYRQRPPIAAKGIVGPVKVFAAVRTQSTLPRPARHPVMQAPLVGRETELRLLLDAFRRTNKERRAHLVTVLGSAGLGKSRLVQEALAQFGESTPARVLHGQCLPYGKGITYWPLMEVLREDTGIAFEDDRETAIKKLDLRLARLIDADQRRMLRSRLAVLLGLEVATDTMPDVPAARVDLELSWAAQRYLRAVAVKDPLVLVVDDLQWADPAVVWFLEQLAVRATEEPILLLCIARPELLEAHPAWAAGSVTATSITLNPLSSTETAALIELLLEVDELPSPLRQRLIERSEGNPLFCEEFLRMLIDEMRLVRVSNRWRPAAAATDVRVPETIHAILAARLDGLSRTEKSTLQAASIVGERFTRAQVEGVLATEESESALEDLERKGFVREVASSGGTRELRFKHLLIRDVAYDAIPKDNRADLHERFERYLQDQLGDRQLEFVEILAHHAERAYGLSRETRVIGTKLQRRAGRALEWSLLRADQALGRENTKVLAGSISVARSAIKAVPDDDNSQLRLALLEAESLRLAARFADGLVRAREAAEWAIRTGNQEAQAAAHLCAARIHARLGDRPDFRLEAGEAARLFRSAGNIAGEIEAEWQQILMQLVNEGGWSALQDAASLGQRARNGGLLAKAADIFSSAAVMAVDQGFADEAERLIAEASVAEDQLALLSRYRLEKARALLGWMRGNLPEAEDSILRLIASLEEAGGVWETIVLRRDLATMLAASGRYTDAEALLARALIDSDETGERWNRTELLALRTRVAIHRQDLAAAARYAALAIESISPEDPGARLEANYACGQLRAAQGRFAEAEAFFRASLEALRETELYAVAAQIHVGIARFFVERGKAAEARPLLDTAEAWLEKAGYSLWLDEISRIRQQASVASPS